MKPSEARLCFPGVRLGGTSWVIPGTLSENLRCLASRVDDMELVLFDTPQASNIPSTAEVRELLSICLSSGVTCSVHFPDDLDPAAPGIEERCLRIIDLFAPLEPSGWVVHLTGERRGDPPSSKMDEWTEKTLCSVSRLVRALPASRELSVETLDYDLRCAEKIIEELDLSVCIDLGHVVRYGFSMEGTLNRWLPRSRLLHLHGVKPDGTDHADLSFFDPGLLKKILERLEEGPERIVTLEVFEGDFLKSLRVLEGWQAT